MIEIKYEKLDFNVHHIDITPEISPIIKKFCESVGCSTSHQCYLNEYIKLNHIDWDILTSMVKEENNRIYNEKFKELLND
jgi:hypothetical protein